MNNQPIANNNLINLAGVRFKNCTDVTLYEESYTKRDGHALLLHTITHLWPSPVRQFLSNYSQQSSDDSRWIKPSREFSLLIELNVGTISMRYRDGNHCYSIMDSMFRNQLCVKLSLNTNNHVTLLAVKVEWSGRPWATTGRRQYSNRTLTTNEVTNFLIIMRPGRWGQ